MLVISKNISI